MSIVIVGMGQMGGVFGRAFLTAGHPVIPVTRRMDAEAIAAGLPDPALALVAVGEADLDPVLAGLPAPWRDRTGLLQNELLPASWQDHGIAEPTVAVVWFEKKAGRPVKVIRPSPVFGPAAAIVAESLATIDIPTTMLSNPAEAMVALVDKNLYILVSNIAGIVSGGTVGELWEGHRELALAVANDVLDVQEALTDQELPRDDLVASLERSFASDPDHGTVGRSAPVRLARAIEHANSHGIAIPTLRRIAAGA